MELLKTRTGKLYVAIFALLLIMNPGMKRFKDYTGSYAKIHTRNINCLLFSVYRCYDLGDNSKEVVKKTYIGLLYNFIKINSSKASDLERQRYGHALQNLK